MSPSIICLLFSGLLLQFEVLPSAGDYEDTLYVTFNPGSAAREEQSDSSPAATVEGVNDQSTHYRYLNIKILFINKRTCSCHLTIWKL